MKKKVILKTGIEIQRIKKTCKVVASTLEQLKRVIKPGIKTIEIDQICRELLNKGGSKSALIGFSGYPGAVCTSLNNIAAHGIPGNVVLQEGDIITVDITAVIDGWHGDAAWTYPVGTITTDARRLLKAAHSATEEGIAAIRPGKNISSIGKAIEKKAKSYGCSVLKQLVGHGIGKSIHEEPRISNVAGAGYSEKILPGMVITVEPIITLGAENFITHSDGWSLLTSDGSLSAQFEHTIAVFADRTEILTSSASY